MISRAAKIGRRRISSAARSRSVKMAARHTPSTVGQGPLLTLSFADWCKTLQIKTEKGLQPFELFDWQHHFSEMLVGDNAFTKRIITLLSSRQTGKTSLLLAIGAYLALSRRQFSAIFIHRTTQDTYLLCRRMKKYLAGVEMVTDSLSLLEFKDSGSTIHFRSCNPSRGADGAEAAGRGLAACGLVVCEEASHTSNLKDTLTVIAPTTQWSQEHTGNVIFVGTASSKQSYYYETLARSAGSADRLEKTLAGIRKETIGPYQVLDKGKGAVGVITNWRAIPRFKAEPNFLERTQTEFDLADSQMNTEYELIFDSSVDSAVFDFGLVMAAQVQQSEIDKIVVDRTSVTYMGVDPAGQGKDYAVAITLYTHTEKDGTKIYTVVDMYRKRTGVSEQHLSAVSDRIDRLRPLSVAIETNAMGQVWLEQLAVVGHSSSINGVATTASSKPVLVGRLQIALERGVLRIPKGIIIDELLAFRRTDTGKLEAGGKAHDDTVIALALALHAAGFNQH